MTIQNIRAYGPTNEPGQKHLHMEASQNRDVNQRNSLLQALITCHGGYEELIALTWPDPLPPEIQEKISKFKEVWTKESEQLQEGYSWKRMKQDVKNGKIPPQKAYSPRNPSGAILHNTKDESWENFRLQAVELIKECVNLRLHNLGLPKIEQWGGVGTPGLDSDIDLSLEEFSKDGKTKLNLGEQDLMLAKTLFETLWTKEFRGLSGEQIDTEVYVRHNGRFSNANALQTQDGTQAFNSIETLAVAITAYKHLTHDGAHPHSPLWDEYKKKTIESLHLNPAQIEAIFTDAELLVHKQLNDNNRFVLTCHYGQNHSQVNTLSDEQVQTEIDRLKTEDPAAAQAISKNQFYYAHPFLMNISRQLDESVKTIESLELQIKQATQNNPSLVEPLKKRLDEARNNFVFYSIVRVTSFPEGYYTEGAYKRVVQSMGGQIFERSKEHLQSEFRTGKTLAEFSKLRGFEKAISIDHAASGAENYALFLYTLEKLQKNGQSPEEALIGACKYLERAFSDDLELVEASRQKVHTTLIKKLTDRFGPLMPLQGALEKINALNLELRKLETDRTRQGIEKRGNIYTEIHNTWKKVHEEISSLPKEEQAEITQLTETLQQEEDLYYNLKMAHNQQIQLLIGKRNIKIADSNIGQIFTKILTQENQGNITIREKMKQTSYGPSDSYDTICKKFQNQLMDILAENSVYHIPRTIKIDALFQQIISDMGKNSSLKELFTNKESLSQLVEAMERSGFRIAHQDDLSQVIDACATLQDDPLTPERLYKILQDHKIILKSEFLHKAIEHQVGSIKDEVRKMSVKEIESYEKQHSLTPPVPSTSIFGKQIPIDRGGTVLKHKLQEFVEKQFSDINVAQKTKMLQDIMIAQSSGADPDMAYLSAEDSYHLVLAQAQKSQCFTMIDMETFNPGIKLVIETAMGLHRSKEMGEKEKVRESSRKISLEKIRNLHEFIEHTKQLHFQTMQHIYKQKLLSLPETPSRHEFDTIWTRGEVTTRDI